MNDSDKEQFAKFFAADYARILATAIDWYFAKGDDGAVQLEGRLRMRIANMLSTLEHVANPTEPPPEIQQYANPDLQDTVGTST